MKTFNHELLRALREHYKINQNRLSKLLGVKLETIFDWENVTSIPNPDQLNLLARIFKVEKNLFFEENVYIPAVIAQLPKIGNAEMERLRLEQKISELKQKLDRMEKRLANLNDSNNNKIDEKESIFQNNPELRFFAEVYPNGGEFLSSDLYANYVKWAEKENLFPISLTAFGLKLKKYYCFSRRRKQPGNYYLIPQMKNFDLDQFLNEI